MSTGNFYIRLITGVLIMALIGAILEGCGNTAERETRIKKALEQKYNEKFEVLRFHRQGIMEQYYTAEVYAESYPELPFLVTMDTEDDFFSDGYVMKRGTNLISSHASENVGKLKGMYYIHTQSMFPDSVSEKPDIELKEYLESEKNNFFTIYLYLDPSAESPDSLYAAVSEILKGLEPMEGSIEIFFADEKRMDRIREYVESHASLEDDYVKLGEDCHVTGIRFCSGRLNISEDEFLDRVRTNL